MNMQTLRDYIGHSSRGRLAINSTPIRPMSVHSVASVMVGGVPTIQFNGVDGEGECSWIIRLAPHSRKPMESVRVTDAGMDRRPFGHTPGNILDVARSIGSQPLSIHTVIQGVS